MLKKTDNGTKRCALLLKRALMCEFQNLCLGGHVVNDFE